MFKLQSISLADQIQDLIEQNKQQQQYLENKLNSVYEKGSTQYNNNNANNSNNLKLYHLVRKVSGIEEIDWIEMSGKGMKKSKYVAPPSSTSVGGDPTNKTHLSRKGKKNK
jgi:hypothetical protein